MKELRQVREAAKAGHFDTLRHLLKTDNHAHLTTAFHASVTDYKTVKRKAEHTEIAKYLIDSGLCPETLVSHLNVPAIAYAAFCGNVEVVDYFAYADSGSDLFISAAKILEIGKCVFLHTLNTRRLRLLVEGPSAEIN